MPVIHTDFGEGFGTALFHLFLLLGACLITILNFSKSYKIAKIYLDVIFLRLILALQNKTKTMYTLQDLTEGRCALIFRKEIDSVDNLREVLRHCFPTDCSIAAGARFYYKNSLPSAWASSDTQPNMNIQDLRLFYQQLPGKSPMPTLEDLKEGRAAIEHNGDTSKAYMLNEIFNYINGMNCLDFIGWHNFYSNRHSTDQKENLPQSVTMFASTDYFYSLLPKNKKETKMNYTITHEEAQRIVDIACESWKSKLFDRWGKSIVLKKKIEVSESELSEMKSAATDAQLPVLNEIFKAPFPAKGTPCLVSDDKISWRLRYATETRNLFYIKTQDDRSCTNWKYWLPIPQSIVDQLPK